MYNKLGFRKDTPLQMGYRSAAGTWYGQRPGRMNRCTQTMQAPGSVRIINMPAPAMLLARGAAAASGVAAAEPFS